LLRVAERAVRRPAPTFAQQAAAAAAAAGSSTSLEDYGRLSSDSLPPLLADQEDDVHLPLSTEMTARFDSILNYFQELSETYLFALRVEIRCHAMYYLDLAMREGNYLLEEEPYEPDAYIDMLNQDLVLIEESIGKAVPNRRTRFLFDGLSFLIRDVLMGNLRYVRRLNLFGVEKLVRNVMSLQQSLTNISAIHEKGLDRVKNYFELLNLTGPVSENIFQN
jgi:exocyst complex component 4